jgi:hypothetical protein
VVEEIMMPEDTIADVLSRIEGELEQRFRASYLLN